MFRTTLRLTIAVLAVAIVASCSSSGVAPKGSSGGMAAAESEIDDRSAKSLYEEDGAAPSTSPAAAKPLAAPTPSAGSSAWAGSTGRGTPSSSGLKAGYSDDNEQFNYFVEFLAKYASVEHYAYDISERIAVKVLDADGRPVPNARIALMDGSRTLATGLTYANGEYKFYPAALGPQYASYTAKVSAGAASAQAAIRRDGPRTVDIRLGAKRAVPSPIPLDVLFVMDTTGSMGEEIERLRDTIAIIHANLNAFKPRPLVRFGMVLYKDRGDVYITEIVPFTDNLEAFQAKLDKVSADGGGDGPEDLESALDDAVNKMKWNADGIRLAFVVTDAEAHLDYGRDYTYVDAANDARSKAIKLYTIGTGGLPLEGEYLLRQVSQLTDARYIFLTYGEGGESGGGSPGSVSHHTGANFSTDKLEAIIIRFVRDEVAYLSDTPPEVDQSYFTADKVSSETRDATLDKLFAEAMGNLADYSTFRVSASTPCAILPIASASDGTASTAEYFTERLFASAAAAEPRRFKLVERKDLQKVLAELELQLSGLVDEASVSKVGALLGAEVLVSGTLYKREERFELFLKLVRVSTAEVLAVTRAKIDLDLGL